MGKYNQRSSSLLNTILAAACGILMTFFSLNYLPVVFLFSPIPFIVLWLSEDRRWALLSYAFSIGICLLLAAGFSKPFFSQVLAVLPYPFILASFIGWSIEKDKDSLETILTAACLILGLFFISFVIRSKMEGSESLAASWSKLKNQAMEQFESIAGEAGGLSPGEDYNLSVGIRQLIDMVPGAVFNLGAFFTMFNIWISRSILNRYQQGVDRFVFSNLSIGRNLGRRLIVSVILIALVFTFVQGGAFKAVRDNVLVMAQGILLLNGLAVMEFYFKRTRLPGFLRFIIYVFFMTAPVFVTIISIFSLIDIFVDFRRFSKEEE